MANTKFVQPAVQNANGPLARDRAWPNRIVLTAVLVVALAAGGAASFTRPGLIAASTVFRFLEFYSGVFSLVALSLTVMGGLLSTDRIVLLIRHRVLLYAVHRALATTAMVFLFVHVLTKIAESHARALDVVVPFLAAHRPVYVGLGTIASYMMIVVAWSGVVRARFASSANPWLWRVVHCISYASWPVALLHGLKAGRAAKTWVTVSYVLCLILVIIAITVRLAMAWGRRMRTPKAQTTGAIRPVGRSTGRSGGSVPRRPSYARPAAPTFDGIPVTAPVSGQPAEPAGFPAEPPAGYPAGPGAPAGDDPTRQYRPAPAGQSHRPPPREQVADYAEGYGLSVPDYRSSAAPASGAPAGSVPVPAPRQRHGKAADARPAWAGSTPPPSTGRSDPTPSSGAGWSDRTPSPTGGWRDQTPSPTGGWGDQTPSPTGGWSDRTPSPTGGWRDPSSTGGWNRPTPSSTGEWAAAAPTTGGWDAPTPAGGWPDPAPTSSAAPTSPAGWADPAPTSPAGWSSGPTMWSRKRRFSDDPRSDGVERRQPVTWTTADYWGTPASDPAADQVRPDQVRPDQGRSDQGRSDQSRVERSRAGGRFGSGPVPPVRGDEPELVDLPKRMRAARSGASDDVFWDYLRGGALR